MKVLITLMIIAAGFFALAQKGKGKSNHGSGNTKGQRTIKAPSVSKPKKIMKHQGKAGKNTLQLKPGKNKSFNHPGNNGRKAFKPKQFHYKKGHVNHVYMYSFGPVSYPTKNYGQWRSQQARSKHKKYKPKAEKEALDAILMINNRNAYLVVEIGRKIDRFEQLVVARHDAGSVTDIQFSLHMATITGMRARHAQFGVYASI